jgi:hypothetical protein
MDDLVNQALAELGDIVRCHCDEAYISRRLHDPSCNCDSAEALDTVKKSIEALTEQRDAARRDAVEAEAYATEVEAKLAKAVNALRKIADEYSKKWQAGQWSRATLSEIGPKP